MEAVEIKGMKRDGGLQIEICKGQYVMRKLHLLLAACLPWSRVVSLTAYQSTSIGWVFERMRSRYSKSASRFGAVAGSSCRD